MDYLDATFTALGDPTRRAILARLREGPIPVHALAKPFAISQQAVSKHLAYLERARLVVKTKVGRENVCQLNPRPMRDAALWLQEYERFWSDAFDRLDDTLKTLHPTSAPKRRTQQ